jgi:hypothetical protein
MIKAFAPEKKTTLMKLTKTERQTDRETDWRTDGRRTLDFRLEVMIKAFALEDKLILIGSEKQLYFENR